jgi:hypothetical protein
MKMNKHPTTNIQHPTPNENSAVRTSIIGCWEFDVERWLFTSK